MSGAAGFPAPIATAMQAWEAETDLFRRQARLIACFESLLQYAAIVAVSEFYAAGLDRDLPDVDGLIREVIHRPSTGTWQRLYREAIGAFREQRAALVSDALYRFGFDDAGRQHPRMQFADKLTRLRNEQKGHGHVLADEKEYRAILDEHEAPLRALLAAAAFARDLTLYVILSRDERGVSAGRLMGPVETARPVDQLTLTSDTPPQGNVGVRHGVTGRWRDLSPLLLYQECEREVDQLDVRGQRTRGRCGRPGLFFHHELIPPGRLRGFEFRYGHHSAWRSPEFEFVARYLERFGRRAGPARETEWYHARIADASRFFVGRHVALAALTRIARQGARRVAFVVAGPGFGKSTLLARWIAQIEGEAEGSPIVVCRHFVQEQYPESGRASNVFDILRHQVCARFGLDPTPPYPDGRPRAERYRTALIETLSLAAGAAKPAIVLVVDGLDEALRTTTGENESLLDWLPGPDLLPPGVSLVLSGRPSVEKIPVFLARFGSGVVERLPLERLTDAEVREWFALVFGPVYALEHQAFLDRVAGAARGHPQYLHFVRPALLDGSLQPGDDDRLPAGLEEFYGRVMQEAAGEQPTSLRVIALLAAASAPLDLGTLSAILGESPDQVARACDAARNVLEWDAAGHTLLFDAEFAEWVRGGDVRSGTDALRRETSEAMSARLLAWCLEWPTHRSAYAATHLVAHLVAAGRHAAVADLARNLEFLGFQSTARPDSPDLPLATFRAALHHATAAGDHAATVEFGLHRAAWTRATLAESPLEALNAASVDRARRLADLHDPAERLAWYFRLAAEIAARDGPAAAERFLGLPSRLPWWPAEGSRTIGDLAGAAAALVSHRALPGFPALWRLYLDAPSRGRLAERLAGQGDIDLAEQVVRATPAGPHRDHALVTLAGQVANTGDFTRAYGFAKDMWRTESRWAAREAIVSVSAPREGLAVVEAVRREAAQDPTARDRLVCRIAISFARAGSFADADAAIRQVEGTAAWNSGLATLAGEALGRRDFERAGGFIARIKSDQALRRSLFDRGFHAALRKPRLADLRQLVRADKAIPRFGIALAVVTAILLGAVLIGPSSWSRFTSWAPVTWLLSALALGIGFRESSVGAAISALAWGALTALGMASLSDAGPTGVSAALAAGGAALFFGWAWLGPDRITQSLVARATVVTIAAVALAGVLTLFAGPGLQEWTLGSSAAAFAILLPAGTAFGASAIASTAVVEERLAYHGAGALPAAVLWALAGLPTASVPMALMVGWVVPGMVMLFGLYLKGVGSLVTGLVNLLLKLFRWLGLNLTTAVSNAASFVEGRLKHVRIAGGAALFLALAEALRAILGRPGTQTDAASNDAGGGIIALVVIVVFVAVIRRQKGDDTPTVESPVDQPAAERPRRALADLAGRSPTHTERFRAELLLRLARLYPDRTSGAAREACRQAATAAGRLDAPSGTEAEEPVRRDLLWQIARESWRRRDLIAAARAAWTVEWRRWSGLLAIACAIVVGLALGALGRWYVPRRVPDDGGGLVWIIAATGAVIAALVATPRLRTLREPLVALPFTLLASGWIATGQVDLAFVALPALVLLLLVAAGAGRSESFFGWLAAAALLLRRQAITVVPGSLLVAGLVALARGESWSAASKLFVGASFVALLLFFFSYLPDTTLRRGARRVLSTRAVDLPRREVSGIDSLAALERSASQDDVEAAVIRMATDHPEVMAGIARAVSRVR